MLMKNHYETPRADVIGLGEFCYDTPLAGHAYKAQKIYNETLSLFQN